MTKITLEKKLNPRYTAEVMKKKSRAPSTTAKRNGRTAAVKPYPDNDPEWDDLEQRYSQINDDMRKLAQLLGEEQ